MAVTPRGFHSSGWFGLSYERDGPTHLSTLPLSLTYRGSSPVFNFDGVRLFLECRIATFSQARFPV